MRTTVFSLVVAAVLAVAGSGCSNERIRAGTDGRDVQLSILAFNDFHGNLEPPAKGLGGAAYFATHLRQASTEHTAIVSAGDLIGATPLVSSFFHDEPTVETANLWGLDYNAVGNHEFDEGSRELLRMQSGGPHPDDGDSPAAPFSGARFQFLAANVIDHATGATLLPPYGIRNYDDIPVAFIGLTLEATPAVSLSSAVEGLSFLDEVETINALVEEIRTLGVEAIVVVIHEGGYPGDDGENDCGKFSGPIRNIVMQTHSAVDLFVTGHTHRRYLCRVDDRPVTSAGTAGRFFTRISTRLNRESGDMTVTDYENVPVTQDVDPDPEVEALVMKYQALVKTAAGRIVGSVSAEFNKEQNDAGESSLGGLIADAQLAATRAPENGGAQVAFMNPGGIRSRLLLEPSGNERVGEVTFAEVFAVHPFGNHLVTMTLTGAEIRELLEQQWKGRSKRNILMPSSGFSYAWSESAPTGSKVDPSSMSLNNFPLKPSARYRVTVNDFLAGGGDGFPLLLQGTERIDGMPDVEALVQYLESRFDVAPAPVDRIMRRP